MTATQIDSVVSLLVSGPPQMTKADVNAAFRLVHLSFWRFHNNTFTLDGVSGDGRRIEAEYGGDDVPYWHLDQHGTPFGETDCWHAVRVFEGSRKVFDWSCE